MDHQVVRIAVDGEDEVSHDKHDNSDDIPVLLAVAVSPLQLSRLRGLLESQQVSA